MLIGVRNRFVFVANSKTASTAIEQALAGHAEIQRGGSPARKHASLREILTEYDFLFGREEYAPESFFIFGVMRDPLDWIGSWFRYRKGNRVGNRLPGETSFAGFWARGDWNITRKDGSPNLQSDRFTAADGTVLADVIIPYHDLAPQFAAICAGLGVDAELPWKNVSRIREIDEDIPPSLIGEIRAHFAGDYALLERLDDINARGMAKLAARGVPMPRKPARQAGAARKSRA